MAHVCYKANSDVCHTAAILDAVTFSIQLTTSSLYKLAVHRAIFLPTLRHQNTDTTARDVTATYNHAHLGTQSMLASSALLTRG